MRRHVVALLVVLGACVWFQAWFLGLTPHGIKLGDPKLSDAYTEALAHGQSYLLQTPDQRLVAAKDPFGPATAALMISDTSYFHGHFYMYFGIVPFITFLLPLRLAIGVPPSPELSILFFSVIGYAAYSCVLLFALKRWYRGTSAPVVACAFLTIATASGTWPLMGRPAIYEIENAAAYAFFGLSILALVRHEWSDDRPTWALALCSAFAGLTMGCRPNYFGAVTLIAAFVSYRSLFILRPKTNSRVHRLLASLLPMSGIGLALALWNFHRFGDPLDFGLKHTVSLSPELARPLSAVANLPYHLHRYVLGLPRIGPYFPFIQGQDEGPFLLLSWQEISNQVYGFLIISPVLATALIVFLNRRTEECSTKLFGYICLTCFTANLAFLCTLTMSCYRYPADFMGPLAVVSAMGLIQASFIPGRLRSLVMIAALSLLAWTTIAVILQTFSTAQTTELFDIKRPASFYKASHIFNTPVYWMERLEHTSRPKMTFTLRFPINKYGQNEPLLVTGENGAQDFIYLFYTSPQTIQVGFESMGLGGIVSDNIPIRYDRDHVIEVFPGSFLPPSDDPIFESESASQIASDRTKLTIKLDGETILAGKVSFHPPRAQIFTGTSPFDPAFGTRFTGSAFKSMSH